MTNKSKPVPQLRLNNLPIADVAGGSTWPAFLMQLLVDTTKDPISDIGAAVKIWRARDAEFTVDYEEVLWGRLASISGWPQTLLPFGNFELNVPYYLRAEVTFDDGVTVLSRGQMIVVRGDRGRIRDSSVFNILPPPPFPTDEVAVIDCSGIPATIPAGYDWAVHNFPVWLELAGEAVESAGTLVDYGWVGKTDLEGMDKATAIATMASDLTNGPPSPGPLDLGVFGDLNATVNGETIEVTTVTPGNFGRLTCRDGSTVITDNQ